MSKKHAGINVGSSSILMIFVILCLVSFAALSIVSSHADYRLSNKVATRTTNYYDACNQAEESIRDLNTVLHELYSGSASADEYFSLAGTEKSYVIEISELQSLQITLDILYPSTGDGAYYSITSWQVITTGSLDYDDTLNVIH